MTARMGGIVSTPAEARTLCRVNNACSVSSVLNCIDAEKSYRGSVTMNFLGDTIVTRTRQLALRYERQGQHIAADTSDSVFVHMNRGTRAFRGIQGGKEWLLHPGEVSLYVHNEPVLLESGEGGDFLGIALPRILTLDWADEPEDMVGRKFEGNAPEFSMLLPYLEFLSEGDLQDPSITEMALKHATDLVGIGIGGRRDGDLSAPTRVRHQFRSITAGLKRRLCDPDLSVEAIASEMGLSVRSVQHVLTQNQTSFSRLLGRLRVERAYRLLQNPAFFGVSVTAIALECGFADLSAFYRHFQRRYDRSPADVRAGR